MGYHSREVGSGQKLQDWYNAHPETTIGWSPRCRCEGVPFEQRDPAIVLDIFNGSGTTGLVARQLGHHYIGIDINAGYLEETQQRLEAVDADRA